MLGKVGARQSFSYVNMGKLLELYGLSLLGSAKCHRVPQVCRSEHEIARVFARLGLEVYTE